jgi:hypothetical protein
MPKFTSQHVNRIFQDLSPVTDKERVIVQTVADTDWRLLRIAPLEASVWAMGFRKLADLYPEETNEATRTSIIQGEVFAFFRRDFSNVALQERRLRNQRIADLAELKALQQERAEKAKEAAEHSQNEMRRANKIVDNARHSKIEFTLAEFGFEFSLDELLAYNPRNLRYGLLTERTLDFATFLTTYRKEQKTA